MQENQKKRLTPGNFVRGVDLAGNRCWGVVYLCPTQCEHVDIRTPSSGANFVHVDAAQVEVIPEDRLQGEELAFLRNAIVELSALVPCSGYSFMEAHRCCPEARS